MGKSPKDAQLIVQNIDSLLSINPLNESRGRRGPFNLKSATRFETKHGLLASLDALAVSQKQQRLPPRRLPVLRQKLSPKALDQPTSQLAGSPKHAALFSRGSPTASRQSQRDLARVLEIAERSKSDAKRFVESIRRSTQSSQFYKGYNQQRSLEQRFGIAQNPLKERSRFRVACVPHHAQALMVNMQNFRRGC